ncbi:MAG: sensor histidine kinase [Bryobacteraceae bacterium]
MEQAVALAASEVFGDRLRGHLEVLKAVLQPRLAALQRRFLERMRRLGYDPRQRKALAAITPGAAATIQAAGGLPQAFIEQAEYNGRRLAKLNLTPARVMRALQEYDRLLGPLVCSLDVKAQAEFRRALEQWYFCVVLSLNNASYQVAEAEAQAYHELFKNELEAGNLDDLLLRMLGSLGRYCRAEAAALFLAERGSSRLRLRAVTPCRVRESVSPHEVTLSRRLRERLSKARCFLTGRDKLDLALHPGWQARFSTCWSIPLVARGKLEGVMQFAFSLPYEWFPREVELLTSAGERCLLAAAKARLVEELAAREAQVRQLAGHMLHVEDRERRRIGAELHDEAGQSLLCIRLQLEMLENTPQTNEQLRAGLREARALTEATIVEIRRLIAALSPAVLEELGLGPALKQLAARLQRYGKLQVKLHVSSLREVPAQVAGAAYRLIQECLNNVVRHASAASVNISAVSSDGELRICVEDDGVGFRIEEAIAKQGSFGLTGMRERVALLGGKLHLESRPKRGTRVSISLPVRGRKGNGAREVE